MSSPRPRPGAAPRARRARPFAPLFLAPLLLAPLLVLVPACGGGTEAAYETSGGGFVITNPTDAKRPYFHDFGVVPVGEVREHTYLLRNTEDRPLTVQKLQPSCGCTVPRVVAIGPDGTRVAGKTFGGGDVVTVPKGGTMELTVVTDTEQVRIKNRDKLNTVRMTCDSEDEPYMAFEQHIWVRQAFNATPPEIDLKLVPEGGGGSSSTELFPAAQGSEARVTGVRSATEGLTVDFREEPRPGGTVTIVTASLEPGAARGPWVGEVWLETTGDDGESEGQPFRVVVRGLVTQDVVCSPGSLMFPRFESGQGATAEAVVRALIPGERLMITGHEWIGDTDGVSVTYEPDAPGADGRSVRWRLRVEVAPELAGKSVRGTLVLKTDIESAEEIRVPYTGSF